MRSAATTTEEKVVRAPQKPVPSRGRRYREETTSAARTTTTASTNAPATLTVRTAQGKSPTPSGVAETAAYRTAPPAQPPANTVATTSKRTFGDRRRRAWSNGDRSATR